MALYVCFDDSLHDPTYTSGDAAFLVDSDSDGDGINPCSEDAAQAFVPVLPSNQAEAVAFAKLQGWDVIIANGTIHFATGISAG